MVLSKKPKKQLIMMYLEDAAQNEMIAAAHVLEKLFPKIQWVFTNKRFEPISKHELKTWMKECLKNE